MLHVVRYRRNDLDKLVSQINAAGYGLTLGVHTRIDETIAQVTGSAHVGNLYVNRNMVGAVVGVQPFGGEGYLAPGLKLADRCTFIACSPAARKRPSSRRCRVTMPASRLMHSLNRA